MAVKRNDQTQVFDDAMAIYASRTEAYGEIWQQYGALSNLLNASRKVARLMSVWWDSQYEGSIGLPALHKDALDDAFDAINYLAFFIRCAREFNITGSRPQPAFSAEEAVRQMCDEHNLWDNETGTYTLQDGTVVGKVF